MSRRECGDCTVCCKVLGIAELDKPVHTVCVNCSTGKRCDAYEARPASCRRFNCVWLTNDTLPDDLKPDRCGIVAFEPWTQPFNGTCVDLILMPDAEYQEASLQRMVQLLSPLKTAVLFYDKQELTKAVIYENGSITQEIQK